MSSAKCQLLVIIMSISLAYLASCITSLYVQLLICGVWPDWPKFGFSGFFCIFYLLYMLNSQLATLHCYSL